MSDERFWDLIARVDAQALQCGDEETAVQPLFDAASTMSRSDLEAFEEALACKLYALDTRRHCDEGGASSNSQDGFLYARCFVVASGKETYDRVLADPSQMPKSVEHWCEMLLTVASTGYEVQTGSEWTFVPRVNYETGSNHRGW